MGRLTTLKGKKGDRFGDISSSPDLEETRMVIRVYLLGRFEARCDRRPLRGLRARKVQECLSYVLLSKQRPVQREKLADQLWQHVDSRCTKKYLRQALWQLQRAYEAEAAADDGPLLAVDQGWIGVHGDAPIWVDAREL